VVIRTLDPPLHEFLPKRENLMVDNAVLPFADIKLKKEISERYSIPVKDLKKVLPELLSRVEELHEFNPMLGHRGCRLGIVYPEISAMQIRAIFEAAILVQKEGIKVKPEIMIPLVGFVKELQLQAQLVRDIAAEVSKQHNTRLHYLVGTMIEIPRACVVADEIAKEAEFFSFGTNDLTQTTLGMSRDDSGSFLPAYQNLEIIKQNPFATVDVAGVGSLMKLAIERGRKTRPDIKLGICGEHGGDPTSVKFCHDAGLTYVSCSPYRVPIARLAAAQAALAAAS
jgi:pyruvate,orthophosphate dikinase